MMCSSEGLGSIIVPSVGKHRDVAIDSHRQSRGETQDLDDGRDVALRNDGRCPAGAQCIRSE